MCSLAVLYCSGTSEALAVHARLVVHQTLPPVKFVHHRKVIFPTTVWVTYAQKCMEKFVLPRLLQSRSLTTELLPACGN